MRMVSFLPFSAERRRRFPVILAQCKHSLSTAVAVVASDLIANSVFDDDRSAPAPPGVSAPLCLPLTMAPLCDAFLRGFRFPPKGHRHSRKRRRRS